MMGGVGVSITNQITTGNLVIVIVMLLGMAVIWWIKEHANRIRAEAEAHRVKNEADQIKVNEAELIRSDYAIQIREFRKEVHGYRNQAQVIEGKLRHAENLVTRKGDRLNMAFFILRLVMDELRLLSRDSKVLAQADALLARIIAEEPLNIDKSAALNAAEHTENAATLAVAEVKQAEDDDKKETKR